MLTGRNVLLVDDESTVLRVLRHWLTENGCQVRCATDGKEAIATIETERPQIMIVDWNMPNMNGIELCGWVRQQEWTNDVYFLLLTAKTELEAFMEAISSGADDFLSKPVTKETLLSRVHLAVRRLAHAAAI